MLYTLANKTQTYADKNMWMPDQASTFAPEVDFLFYFILAINIIFFVLIAILVVVFAIRYRRSTNPVPRGTATHSTGLELFWSIIPFIVVMYTFYLGFKGYNDMTIAPTKGAYTINVTGQKWVWSFTYPNGYVDSDLHIPEGRPVRLILSSPDVIHSLFIPAFRAKKDVVPGRFNEFWVQATRIPESGSYPIYCTEYCGTSHSTMIANLYVHKQEDFEEWLKIASDIYTTKSPDGEGKVAVPWAQVGEKLVRGAGCFSCHTHETEDVIIGPSFKNLWAKGEEILSDGTRVKLDLEYLRESIEEPNAKVVKGFEGKLMTPYRNRFSTRDYIAIEEYLKSLSPNYVPRPTLSVEELAAPAAK
jgi:cytochrome c oxidase subunit 2